MLVKLLGFSLEEIHMLQGRSVRVRIVRQKEQRYDRNKRQKYRTARGEAWDSTMRCRFEGLTLDLRICMLTRS